MDHAVLQQSQGNAGGSFHAFHGELGNQLAVLQLHSLLGEQIQHAADAGGVQIQVFRGQHAVLNLNAGKHETGRSRGLGGQIAIAVLHIGRSISAVIVFHSRVRLCLGKHYGRGLFLGKDDGLAGKGQCQFALGKFSCQGLTVNGDGGTGFGIFPGAFLGFPGSLHHGSPILIQGQHNGDARNGDIHVLVAHPDLGRIPGADSSGFFRKGHREHHAQSHDHRKNFSH